MSYSNPMNTVFPGKRQALKSFGSSTGRKPGGALRILFNVAAIISCAILAGVMLAIGMVLGGYWSSLPASDFLDWFGRHEQLIIRTIIAVLVPTVISLIGSLAFDWHQSERRAFWLGAIICIAATLILTAVWFLPTNAQFVSRTIPLDQVPARLETWLMLHNARIILATVASALGILAVSR